MASTRRWLDRGNPRDAGVRHACQGIFTGHEKALAFAGAFPFLSYSLLILLRGERIRDNRIDRILGRTGSAFSVRSDCLNEVKAGPT